MADIMKIGAGIGAGATGLGCGSLMVSGALLLGITACTRLVPSCSGISFPSAPAICGTMTMPGGAVVNKPCKKGAVTTTPGPKSTGTRRARTADLQSLVVESKPQDPNSPCATLDIKRGGAINVRFDDGEEAGCVSYKDTSELLDTSSGLKQMDIYVGGSRLRTDFPKEVVTAVGLDIKGIQNVTYGRNTLQVKATDKAGRSGWSNSVGIYTFPGDKMVPYNVVRDDRSRPVIVSVAVSLADDGTLSLENLTAKDGESGIRSVKITEECKEGLKWGKPRAVFFREFGTQNHNTDIGALTKGLVGNASKETCQYEAVVKDHKGNSATQEMVGKVTYQ
jgi:hypothetical protein